MAKRKLTIDILKSHLIKINSNLEILSEEFTGGKTYCLVKCKECGYRDWETILKI